MTIEPSHGKPRLTKPRVGTMHRGAAPEQIEQRREQLRENARYRGSKEATRAPLKAAAGAKVRRALGRTATPEESRLVAENALQLATDAAREVAVASPFVAHATTRFGVNAALAGFYTQKAAEAGFDTECGLALLDAAHRCERAAERAMVAASAAVKEFAGKQKPIDVHGDVARAFAPATSEGG
jgi:hypothetical protein